MPGTPRTRNHGITGNHQNAKSAHPSSLSQDVSAQVPGRASMATRRRGAAISTGIVARRMPS